ncbi:hypothetical protein MMC11_004462 [Xylographa trunciseda]|nr:hypothetical protein [Xylographa trunciseda]
MFSYLNGIRPSTRRAASSQAPSQHQLDINGSKHEISAHTGQRYLSSSSGGYSAFGGLNSRPSTADPPSLPPIPRVASQYGDPDTITTSSTNFEGVTREGKQSYNNLVLSTEDDRQSTINLLDEDVTSGRREVPLEHSSSLPKFSQSLKHRWAEAVPISHRATQTREAPSYGESDSTTSRRTIEAADGRNQSTQNSLPPTSSHPQLPPIAVTIQTRHGRPKLNLLNPMSILSRRRSAQTIVQVNDNSYSATRHTSSNGSRLPDDYDPRIRGNVVHDFSAPRSRPYVDSRDRGWAERKPSPYGRSEDAVSSDSAKWPEGHSGSWPLPSVQSPAGESVQSTERQHTPVFKEQFEDEMEPWRFDIEDRRNQHTTGLLERMVEEEPRDGHSPLPPFARNFPSDVARNLHMQNASFLTPRKTPPLTISETDTSVISPPHSRGAAKVTSTTTPPKSRSRATSLTDPNFPGAGLPKHFKSNASRFSFDLAGIGSSTQEKLLEERHRQKNAPRRHGSMASRVSAATTSVDGLEEDDEIMGEDEEYDGLLEERIPGVNADADDDTGYEIDDVSQATIFSLPQDAYRPKEGKVRIYDDSTNYPDQLLEVSIALGISNANAHRIPIRQAQLAADFVSGESAASNLAASQPSIKHLVDPSTLRPQKRIYDDDLYFDDGMIDQFDDWDSTTFDESVFDDDTNRIYGLPLRDLKPLPNIVESSSAETSQQSTRPISAESGSKPYHAHPNVDSETATNYMPPPNTIPVRKTSLVNKVSTIANFNQSIGLTSDNLAAYHNALASAADRAARDGRFDRKLSIDEGEQEAQNLIGIHKPHVSFDEQKIGQAHGLTEPFITEGNTNDFSFDDEQDDEAIIAAANAEALENDDEGFYGREFGFFAHASGSAEAQYANGGYFGPAGIDGLKRSHSGKANFQEPSLTPITERSEWSQRNSMVSLPMQNLFSPSLPTPGLAQLADALQYEDDNMSLSALLKLRRGAFGGSDASLVSSGSHKSGSPQSYLPPTSGAALSNALSGSHLASSSYSLVSNSEIASDNGLHPGNPTLTLQTQGLMMNPPGTLQDKSSGSDSSPKRRNAVKGSGHSRSSSGTESVSYIKELDEDGAGRWVLEKRRTAEGGQIEILGRQVVEGGRI